MIYRSFFPSNEHVKTNMCNSSRYSTGSPPLIFWLKNVQARCLANQLISNRIAVWHLWGEGSAARHQQIWWKLLETPQFYNFYRVSFQIRRAVSVSMSSKRNSTILNRSLIRLNGLTHQVVSCGTPGPSIPGGSQGKPWPVKQRVETTILWEPRAKGVIRNQ